MRVLAKMVERHGSKRAVHDFAQIAGKYDTAMKERSTFIEIRRRGTEGRQTSLFLVSLFEPIDCLDRDIKR